MLNTYIEELRPYVMELFSGDSTGHDISHLTRTMNLALTICREEGGDEQIVGISAFLHDVHRIMQKEAGRYVSPRESLPKVKEILSHTDLDEDTIEQICYCIEHHEEYVWNGNMVSDKNTLILQDADNLDAIGAIGIGRSFAYGGAHGMKIYDESLPLDALEDYIEDNGNDASTIHHFYHKLLHLENSMNTEYAKAIARRRTQFMREFTEEFLNEWNGKC